MRRALLLVRLSVGAVGLLQPRVAVRIAGGDPGSHGVVVTTRVLGARHLLQATALWTRPGHLTAAVSNGVDVLHGASMVALAAVSSDLRRPALASAGWAFGLSGVLHLLENRSHD